MWRKSVMWRNFFTRGDKSVQSQFAKNFWRPAHSQATCCDPFNCWQATYESATSLARNTTVSIVQNLNSRKEIRAEESRMKYLDRELGSKPRIVTFDH